MTMDSLKRRIYRLVTRANPKNKCVCCLPGSRIRNVDPRLKRILMAVGENPLIVLHVRASDISRFPLELIKDVYTTLKKMLKEVEAQVIFNGILLLSRDGG